MIKKLVFIFILAFFLNLVWENLHVNFYVHYKGGEITEWILLRAAAVDATFITVMGFFFLKSRFLCKRLWLSFFFGISSAVALENYALQTGRWAYNELMPIIPVIATGLTPTVQLGLLAFIIFRLVELGEK